VTLRPPLAGGLPFSIASGLTMLNCETQNKGQTAPLERFHLSATGEQRTIGVLVAVATFADVRIRNREELRQRSLVPPKPLEEMDDWTRSLV
jgi:hypothetical protein